MKKHYPLSSFPHQVIASAFVVTVLILCSCSNTQWVLGELETDIDSLGLREAPHRIALLDDGRTALSYRLWLLRNAGNTISKSILLLFG